MSLKHCVVISYDIIKTAYQDTTSEMLFLSLIYFYTVWLFFLFVTVSRWLLISTGRTAL